MKHQVVFLFIAPLLVLTFLATSAFANAPSVPVVFSSPHITKVHPYASGGGCGPSRVGGRGDFVEAACINYAFPLLQGDGYVSFYPLKGHGYIQSCFVTASIYDADQATVVSSEIIGCQETATAGKHNVHYGPTQIAEFSGRYRSTIKVNTHYSDGTVSLGYSNASPDLTV